MKIYFAGSIRGGREDVELYMKLIALLEFYGSVLTEHVGHGNVSAQGERGLSDVEIYERDMAWLRESDVVVAEVTTPSLGVGYELGKAEDMIKPLLCLFRAGTQRSLSAMVAGNKRITVVSYVDLAGAADEIKKFFGQLKK